MVLVCVLIQTDCKKGKGSWVEEREKEKEEGREKKKQDNNMRQLEKCKRQLNI